MLVFILLPLIMIIVDRAVGDGTINQKMGEVPAGKKGKILNAIASGLLILLILYSIFLPLKVGTIWFYTGLPIYLLGSIMFLTSIVNIAATPLGKVRTEGAYRFSRHPGYFSASVILLGVSITSASWLFLLLAVCYTAAQNSQLKSEEQNCLEIFGEEYSEYKDRTPRWIGLPGQKKP